VDPFIALTQKWRATATRLAVRPMIAAWSARALDLAGFETPAELVDTTTRAGNPARSCPLLAELLVVADTDPSAGLAVLQTVLPGIRHATAVRWRRAAAGPWLTIDEVGADAVAAAWEAIWSYGGHHQPRPARVIVRHVEQGLRRTHARSIREREFTKSWDAVRECVLASRLRGMLPEEQAMALINEGLRSDAIDPLATALLIVTGVPGYPTTEAARIVALPYWEADRRLRRARRAMRTWIDRPADARSLLMNGVPA
jgi:DNA-directed RNA polymerase specialized sigma24 family protein